MNTDWGSFTLYVAFVAGLVIAGHAFEAIGRALADKKMKGGAKGGKY